jgi:hypothetical protein
MRSLTEAYKSVYIKPSVINEDDGNYSIKIRLNILQNSQNFSVSEPQVKVHYGIQIDHRDFGIEAIFGRPHFIEPFELEIENYSGTNEDASREVKKFPKIDLKESQVSYEPVNREGNNRFMQFFLKEVTIELDDKFNVIPDRTRVTFAGGLV